MASETETHDEKFCRIVLAMGGVCTARELSRHVWMYRRVVLANAALEGLVERGHGQWVQAKSGPRGGRPTRFFSLFSGDASEQASAMAQNSHPAQPISGDVSTAERRVVAVTKPNQPA